MGEYANTYAQIGEINTKKKKLKARIAELQEEIEALEMECYELDIEKGECEGYLLELDYIDNGSCGCDEPW